MLDSVDHLLSATNDIVIATGILNLWMNDPSRCCGVLRVADGRPWRPVPDGYRRQSRTADRRDRAGRYRKPLAATASFLDALDGAEQPVPVDARVLAALGPKMLALAANRSRGAHPYLVTPEHTHRARELLG